MLKNLTEKIPMTIITIPTGTDSCIRIPAQPEKTEQPVERIGVSVETAAEMLAVCPRTMWNLAKEQKVRTVRIGTRVIFSVQSLREFIDGVPANADNNGIACVAEGKENYYGNTNNR
jgi:hypothetical protein